MTIKFTDNALTTLASGITNVATQLTVAAGKGANFPAVTAGSGFFLISMEDASGNHELIKCSDRATDLMGSGGYPLVRGYGGTTARAWLAGDSVDLRWCSQAVVEKDAEYAAAYLPVGGTAVAATTAVTVTGAAANGTVGTTQAPLDNSTKLATTAYVDAVGTAAWSTGDVKVTLKTVADTGWIFMNDLTIGNAASGATGRANADTVALYTLLWNGTTNAECGVSSGRGASAAADYAANKTLALPKSLGRALAVAGAGAGLTSRALAVALGDENLQTHTHVATVTDPGHTHPYRGSSAGGGVGDFINQASNNAPNSTTENSAPTTSVTGVTVSNANAGTGAAQNMQPTVFLNVMVKL